ncbi:alpha-amylase family glycosyl hydrolase [Dactylosporangium sp. NPDC051485]|uniref:alpha-amylase family glycosyl hydrolase n=1 Tax=Dactylosporangium sp. NPDC051485 TaxID=3154846 RepID=UPI0034288667
MIYSLDVRTFQDSNDDGIGDLQGVTSRIDYLSRLGINTLWLSPIHPRRPHDGWLMAHLLEPFGGGEPNPFEQCRSGHASLPVSPGRP